MKLVCTIDIINRVAQSAGLGGASKLLKPSKGVVQVRNRADGGHNLVLSTNKEINAYEYKVRSIQAFRTKFVDEGRATIEISEPPMSIMLRDCKPEELRAFVDNLNKLRSGGKMSAALKESQCGKVKSEKVEVAESMRKSLGVKRPRSPELSKSEVARIKKTLSGEDKIISVKDRANYPKEFPRTAELIKITAIRLRKLDTRMFRLAHLNHLDLSGNCLKDVEGLAKMNSTLTVLILAKNEISNVSDEFFDGEPFRSLVQLDLSGNMLTKVPSSVVRVLSLTNVNFKNNRIRYLPYNWMDMKNLRVLNFGKNELSFIPVTILHLQLNTLDMSENPNLQTTTDLKSDYVGYSSLPTLFEITSELLMNMQRKKQFQMDAALPSIVTTYLQGGKYCIECNKMSLRHKIIKQNVKPSAVGGTVYIFSANFTHCLVKKIICLNCDRTLPRRRASKVGI